MKWIQNLKQRNLYIPLMITLMSIALLYRGIYNYKDFLGYNMKKEAVLISTQALPQGHKISTKDLTIQYIPQNYLPIGALLEMDQPKIIGHILTRPISHHEIFLWSAIDTGYMANTPSRKIAKGYRAISISVDATSSVSQSIRSGDHVDLVITMTPPNQPHPVTMTLLQNITVLDIGTNVENSEQSNYSNISLMILPKEVSTIVHAEQHGKISLALRNLEDQKTPNDLPIVDLPQLLQTAFRNSMQNERNHSIEIIRGNKTNTNE